MSAAQRSGRSSDLPRILGPGKEGQKQCVAFRLATPAVDDFRPKQPRLSGLKTRQTRLPGHGARDADHPAYLSRAEFERCRAVCRAWLALEPSLWREDAQTESARTLRQCEHGAVARNQPGAMLSNRQIDEHLIVWVAAHQAYRGWRGLMDRRAPLLEGRLNALDIGPPAGSNTSPQHMQQLGAHRRTANPAQAAGSQRLCQRQHRGLAKNQPIHHNLGVDDGFLGQGRA